MKSTFELVNDLITALSNFAWPVMVLIIFLCLRKEIVKIFPRVKKWNVLGNEVEVESLSTEEIEAKNKEEIREIIVSEDTGDQNPASNQQEETKNMESVAPAEPSPVAESAISIPTSDYARKIPEIEKKILDKLEKASGFPIQRQVRLGNYMFDGFAINRKGRLYFFEVKVFPYIVDSNGRLQKENVLERLKISVPQLVRPVKYFANQLGRRQPPILLVPVVLNTNQDLKEIIDETKSLKDALNRISPSVVIKFLYFNLPKLL